MYFTTTKTRGIFYALASGFFYGFMGYFGISIIKSGISVYNMMFWRFAVASLFILVIMPFTKSIKPSFIEILKVIFFSGSVYCLGSISYFIASKEIGTGLAMVIFFTYPAIVVFINLLVYKKKVDNIYYVAIAMILLGMILLSDITNLSLDLYGISFAMISAIFFAIYITISKNNYIDPIVSTVAVSIGCMLTALILAIVDRSFFVPSDLMVWSNIFSIGIICTAVPILLLLKSMKYISSEQASIFSVSEPLFTVIFGMILLGEIINIKQSIGIVVLLSGALVTLLPKKN